MHCRRRDAAVIAMAVACPNTTCSHGTFICGRVSRWWASHGQCCIIWHYTTHHLSFIPSPRFVQGTASGCKHARSSQLPKCATGSWPVARSLSKTPTRPALESVEQARVAVRKIVKRGNGGWRTANCLDQQAAEARASCISWSPSSCSCLYAQSDSAPGTCMAIFVSQRCFLKLFVAQTLKASMFVCEVVCPPDVPAVRRACLCACLCACLPTSSSPLPAGPPHSSYYKYPALRRPAIKPPFNNDLVVSSARLTSTSTST